jgi:hypothetical protein
MENTKFKNCKYIDYNIMAMTGKYGNKLSID